MTSIPLIDNQSRGSESIPEGKIKTDMISINMSTSSLNMFNKSKIESEVKTIADCSDLPKYDFNVSTKALVDGIKVDKTEENKSALNNTSVVRSSDVHHDRSGIYRFKPSGIGDSWLIGIDVDSDDVSNYANAFKKGISDCPPDLTIPSTLTDEYGQTKKVEIIGQYAFFACADETFNGQTRKLTLTRQVKVIKYRGLGNMDDLVEFILEDGSVLETIESNGMYDIGLYPGKTESNRVTLTLPSTLSSVFRDGIHRCNLFNVIIYCGSNPLSNSSDLELNGVSDTKVKVSSRYPSDEKIFNRTTDRNSQAEVHEECMKMALLSESIRCPVIHKFPFMVLHSSLLLSDNNKEEELHSFAKAQVRVVIEKCEACQTTKSNLIAFWCKRNKLKQAAVT